MRTKGWECVRVTDGLPPVNVDEGCDRGKDTVLRIDGEIKKSIGAGRRCADATASTS